MRGCMEGRVQPHAQQNQQTMPLIQAGNIIVTVTLKNSTRVVGYSLTPSQFTLLSALYQALTNLTNYT